MPIVDVLTKGIAPHPLSTLLFSLFPANACLNKCLCLYIYIYIYMFFLQVHVQLDSVAIVDSVSDVNTVIAVIVTRHGSHISDTQKHVKTFLMQNTTTTYVNGCTVVLFAHLHLNKVIVTRSVFDLIILKQRNKKYTHTHTHTIMHAYIHICVEAGTEM